MHAVVLVGGFGTRLRPLTLTVPKPLLPVAHRPMLERLLASLAAGGVTDAVLALGFNPQPFLDAFPGDRCGGVRLRYAVEDSPLDTAGAIGFAAREAGVTGTFVVANGDILTGLDVGSLVAFHRRSGAEATISLVSVADPSQFGIVETATDGRVLRFVEKPAPGDTDSRHASAGTYVMEASCLDRMPGDAPLSIERAVFPQIVADGGLYAMATDDYWVDAGRPETFIEANLMVAAHDASAQAVHAGARCHSTATVTESIVGDGASVGEGATVRRSVLLPGAAVGAGCTVVDSVVMGRVGEGASIEGCVVGADATVDAGSVLSGERIPRT